MSPITGVGNQTQHIGNRNLLSLEMAMGQQLAVLQIGMQFGIPSKKHSARMTSAKLYNKKYKDDVLSSDNMEQEDQLYQVYERRPQKKTSTYSKKWSNEENSVYLKCLEVFREQLENQERRKKTRIFKKISLVLGNRTSEQCRGHHKKLMEKYGNIDRIIQSFAYLQYEQAESSSQENLMNKSSEATCSQGGSELSQSILPYSFEGKGEEWQTYLDL